MTELGGEGHEKRAESGTPRRDRPDRAARSDDSTGLAGRPSEPAGDRAADPTGAAAAPSPASAGGQDLRGRYVSYDGWTPPSDDPLFGGPRSYAFSFDHLAAGMSPDPDSGPAGSTSAKSSTPQSPASERPSSGQRPSDQHASDQHTSGWPSSEQQAPEHPSSGWPSFEQPATANQDRPDALHSPTNGTDTAGTRPGAATAAGPG
ncbi:hypothetical protein ND748_21740, partial [Frankia sp. AiPs1]|nr:hypothetical protein [Frankia sp. AiPs1]